MQLQLKLNFMEQIVNNLLQVFLIYLKFMKYNVISQKQIVIK